MLEEYWAEGIRLPLFVPQFPTFQKRRLGCLGQDERAIRGQLYGKGEEGAQWLGGAGQEWPLPGAHKGTVCPPWVVRAGVRCRDGDLAGERGFIMFPF